MMTVRDSVTLGQLADQREHWQVHRDYDSANGDSGCLAHDSATTARGRDGSHGRDGCDGLITVLLCLSQLRHNGVLRVQRV